MFASRYAMMIRQVPAVNTLIVMRQERVFSAFSPFAGGSTSSGSGSGVGATTDASASTTQQPNFSTVATTNSNKSPKDQLNRTKLAEEIAHNHELSLSKSQRILNTVLDTIAEAVGKETRVTLKNFGTFDSYVSKERTGRNPSTGELMQIPATRRIRFKASSTFKKNAN